MNKLLAKIKLNNNENFGLLIRTFFENFNSENSLNLKDNVADLELLFEVPPKEIIEALSNYEILELNLTKMNCKPPVIRKISNESHITDLHVAVNRAYNSSDYIPCIVWDASALLASSCKVGDRILLLGRIQSRDYLKHRVENPQESDYKRIYEVCIFKFKNLNASGKN